jgi:rubrerythrin
MTVKFNAEEVLDIAVKIEENGRDFYTEAADVVDDAKAKELLLNLASWEQQHIKTFGDMLKNIKNIDFENPYFDPDKIGIKYLEEIAGGSIFCTDTTVDELLKKAGKSIKGILQYALLREQESVVFYLAISKVVPEGDERDSVNRIIEEEMDHVIQISKYITDNNDSVVF